MVTRGVALLFVLAGCESILDIPSSTTPMQLAALDVRDMSTDTPGELSPAFDPTVLSYSIVAPPARILGIHANVGDPEVFLQPEVPDIPANGGSIAFDIGVAPGETRTIEIAGTIGEAVAGGISLRLDVAGSDFDSGLNPEFQTIIAATAVARSPTVNALALVQPNNPDNVRILSFGAPTIAITVPDVEGVAAGSLDGDTFGDLAFAVGGSVRVAYGTSNGFEDTVEEGTGSGIAAVAIADVAGNGAPDLVLGGAGSITIRTAIGARTFGNEITLPAGTQTRALVTGKFRSANQSVTDLAAIDDDGTLRVYTNDSGLFSPEVHPLPAGFVPRGLAFLAQQEDATFAVVGSDRLLVISRYFSQRTTLEVAMPGANAVTTADFDGDGLGDLVVGTPAGPQVLFGRGGIDFYPPLLFPTTIDNPSAAMIIKLDADPAPDVAIAGANGVATLTSKP